MALLGSKKKKETIAENASASVDATAMRHEYLNVLSTPRITEKATEKTAEGVYVFDVAVSANKTQVRQAVSALFNVVPRKVRMVSIPRKQVFARGKKGKTAAGKKAYVYLKKGETINLS